MKAVVLARGGGVVNVEGGHLFSFGSISKPNSHAKPLHDAVSAPSMLFCRKSGFVPKCVETKASSKSRLSEEVKRKFGEVFDVLKWELLNDPIFEWTHTSRQWVEQMMDYNIPKGKLVRGLSVIYYYKSLKDGEDLSDDELFLASVLGWCIEWCQASALILDDIVDTSEMRRGQPSWYKNPKVGMTAIIDGMMLQQQISRIHNKYFIEKPYYLDLWNLFTEVKYQTVLGQLVDTITNTGEENDLSKYSFTLYHHIARYKTSYYTFYLPFACALLLAGENLENHTKVRDVLLEMGIYFQVEDDYKDCFGDPLKTGKIGTDIENRKCTWLLLKALEICNEEEKKILLESYGKSDPAHVAKVKAIYNKVDIHSAFISYKWKTFDKLRSCAESHPTKAMNALWKPHEEALMDY